MLMKGNSIGETTPNNISQSNNVYSNSYAISLGHIEIHTMLTYKCGDNSNEWSFIMLK